MTKNVFSIFKSKDYTAIISIVTALDISNNEYELILILFAS